MPKHNRNKQVRRTIPLSGVATITDGHKKENSRWLSYKALSFFMVCLTLLGYLFKEKILGEAAEESSNLNQTLLLDALISNGIVANPNKFSFTTFESCKANLYFPELLGRCIADICEYVATIMPPLNRLPHDILMILQDSSFAVLPGIPSLETSNMALFQQYERYENDILWEDGQKIRVMTNLHINNMQHAMINYQLSHEVTEFLTSFGVVAIRSCLRTCTGLASLAATILTTQPGIITAKFIIDVVSAANKQNNMPHTIVNIKHPNGSLAYVADPWSPSLASKSTVCSRNEIKKATGTKGCVVYQKKYWRHMETRSLRHPNITTLSQENFPFFKNTVVKFKAFAESKQTKLAKQIVPAPLFPAPKRGL